MTHKEEFLQTLAQLSSAEITELYAEARQTYKKKSVFEKQQQAEKDSIRQSITKNKVRR